MKLIEIKDKEKYNNFVAGQKYSQFLQSWEWGEFNQALGFGVKVLGLEEKGELAMALTLIRKDLGLGKSYWYLPRVNFEFQISNFESIFNFLIIEFEKNVYKEDIIFLRFEPLNKFKIQNSKFKIERTLDVQPSKTLILDISSSEEELLKNFKQKIRYNIRLAGKKGVVVREMKDENDFESWWKIMEETKTRDGFRLHNKEYYRKMLTSPQPSPYKGEGDNLKLKLYIAEYKGKIIAGNIVSFFGDMATYVHGASSDKHRNVMAPYLLQWEAIKSAKSYGCKYYDFHGIDEKKWPGVTRFKLGFGGEEINYPGTFDLVFSNKKYWLYKIVRKVRRIL